MSTPEILRWEDPPASQFIRNTNDERATRWAGVIVQLQLNPGRWAVVAEGTRGSCSGTGWMIRRGSLAGFDPPGSFEAATRGPHGGVCYLYVRYVGGEDA
jgi:hypothetical protein